MTRLTICQSQRSQSKVTLMRQLCVINRIEPLCSFYIMSYYFRFDFITFLKSADTLADTEILCRDWGVFTKIIIFWKIVHISMPLYSSVKKSWREPESLTEDMTCVSVLLPNLSRQHYDRVIQRRKRLRLTLNRCRIVTSVSLWWHKHHWMKCDIRPRSLWKTSDMLQIQITCENVLSLIWKSQIWTV